MTVLCILISIVIIWTLNCANCKQVIIDSGNGLAQKAAAINSSNDGPVHWCSYKSPNFNVKIICSYESPNFNVKIICEALYDLQILMPHQISKSVLVLLFDNISSFNAVTINNWFHNSLINCKCCWLSDGCWMEMICLWTASSWSNIDLIDYLLNFYSWFIY